MIHEEPHPLAGKLVDGALVVPGGKYLGNFTVEDWADRVFGKSWMDMIGNPLALDYALRNGIAMAAVRGTPIIDNDVVYAKSERTGAACLIHNSEIVS